MSLQNSMQTKKSTGIFPRSFRSQCYDILVDPVRSIWSMWIVQRPELTFCFCTAPQLDASRRNLKAWKEKESQHKESCKDEEIRKDDKSVLQQIDNLYSYISSEGCTHHARAPPASTSYIIHQHLLKISSVTDQTCRLSPGGHQCFIAIPDQIITTEF